MDEAFDGELKSARIVLEDGAIFHGDTCGEATTRCGEIVFNTSMTGYQEILTDPSYAGQIVVMTAPHIGNTGVNDEDDESGSVFCRGLVVRKLSRRVSNWRARGPLDAWMSLHGVPIMSDVDTRALTRRLRERGSMKAVLTGDASLSDAALAARAHAWPGLDGVDLVRSVTCESAYAFGGGARSVRVVVYDFGVKRNILRRLVAHGCQVHVVPATTPAEAVLAMRPDGIVLSNGPGDPAAVGYAVEAARRLLAARVPMLGICLGHQIIAQALGARTYRLKFGHHGGNQPVKHLPSGLIEISAHNHNFAVDAATLPPEVELTHVNLNDKCCEGFRHRTRPVIGIQYHPEAAPGPHDADAIFSTFVGQASAQPVGA